MSPASTTCPRCRRTIWKGAACDCPRRPTLLREEPPQPGSRAGKFVAMAVLVCAAGLALGWWLNSVFGVFK